MFTILGVRDAYAGFRFLATHAPVANLIDLSQVSLVGWSHGASAVLATMSTLNSDLSASPEPSEGYRFRCGAAYYPGCGLYGTFGGISQSQWSPYNPVRIFHGSDDSLCCTVRSPQLGCLLGQDPTFSSFYYERFKDLHVCFELEFPSNQRFEGFGIEQYCNTRIANAPCNTSMLQMHVFANVQHSFDEADNPSPNSKFTQADQDAAVAAELDVWAFLSACRTGSLPGVGSVPAGTNVGSTAAPSTMPAPGEPSAIDVVQSHVGHCVTAAAYLSDASQCELAAEALGLEDTTAAVRAYEDNPVSP